MDAWLNGTFVPAESVTVPVLTHSFCRGSAIFEVLDLVETADGPALFRVDEHIERLFSSAERMHMVMPLSKQELHEAIVETARRSNLPRAVIRVMAYYGEPDLAFVPKNTVVSVAVFCFTFSEVIGCTYEEGTRPVEAGITSIRKLSPRTVDVHAKVAGNYVSPFLAKWEAVQKGLSEPILLSEEGFVTEGALCNVFFVREGVLCGARSEAVLGGITRDSIVEIAHDLDIRYEECDLTRADALDSDEAFFSGSCIRVRPIRTINGEPVGEECPGPVTTEIQSELERAYAGRSERHREWLTKV
jgi:branched-chain amino acid aminotransferase